MNSRQDRPQTIGLNRLNAVTCFVLLLIFASNSIAEQLKVTGKVQFLRYELIHRQYRYENNFATGKFNRILIPLSETLIKDALGEIRWQDAAFQEVSSVFTILDEEFDFSNIPICAKAPSKNVNTVTDKNGSFEITLSSSTNIGIVVSANGGQRKSPACNSSETISLREDIKGSTYYVMANDFLHYGDYRFYPVNIILYITLDGELLQLQKQVDELVSRIPSLQLNDILKRREDLLGNNTSFVTRYPKSGAVIRDSILSIAERNILAKADSAFDEKKLDSALILYSDLARLSPTSPGSNEYASKKELTLVAISKKRTDDSLHAYCVSLIAIANALPTKSNSIKFLESKRKGNTDANPYWHEIEERIQSLKSEIETQKDEAEFNRERRADLSALKKFKVDLDITLMDFFSNPFALKGKYIAIRCIVVKFETPKSAIMEADKRFYADFIVTPPKKFEDVPKLVEDGKRG